jgi:hypothetical protein
VRSPNREGPQANVEEIRRIAEQLGKDERDGVQLYLTDYQSLYVGDVDVVRAGERAPSEGGHVPAYYRQEKLDKRSSRATSGFACATLIVTRPDGRRFFDDEERDQLTDGALWAEFDARNASAVAVMEGSSGGTCQAR